LKDQFAIYMVASVLKTYHSVVTVTWYGKSTIKSTCPKAYLFPTWWNQLVPFMKRLSKIKTKTF